MCRQLADTVGPRQLKAPAFPGEMRAAIPSQPIRYYSLWCAKIKDGRGVGRAPCNQDANDREPGYFVLCVDAQRAAKTWSYPERQLSGTGKVNVHRKLVGYGIYV